MNISDILRMQPLFARAKPARLDVLARTATVRRHKRGDQLVVEGEPSEHLFVLTEGIVGVFYSNERGGSVLVKIFGAPAVFGEMELLTGLPRLELVEAFEPTVSIVLARAPVLELWREDAPSTMIMMKDLARRLCVAAYHERMLAFFDVETRLAALLLSFMDAYARSLPDGRTKIRTPLSHEMLGRCLGASSRSIDRAFAKWSAAGLVERDKGYLVVASRAALAALAPADHLALFNRMADEREG